MKEKREKEKWREPLKGWLKCNVDASYLEDGKRKHGLLYFVTIMDK
jgi:hypothetical protein